VTRTTRVQGRRHGVDWGGHISSSLFPEVVPEIGANPEHKRLNLYMRALLFLHQQPDSSADKLCHLRSRAYSAEQVLVWQSLSALLPSAMLEQAIQHGLPCSIC